MGFGEFFGFSSTRKTETANTAPIEIGSIAYAEAPNEQKEENLEGQENNTQIEVSNSTAMDDGEERTVQMYQSDSVSSDEKKIAESVVEVAYESIESVAVNAPETNAEVNLASENIFNPESVVEDENNFGEEDVDVHPEVLVRNDVIVGSPVAEELLAVEVLDAEVKKEKLATIDKLLHKVILLSDDMKMMKPLHEISLSFVSLGGEIVTFGRSLSVLEKNDAEIGAEMDMLYGQVILMRKHIAEKAEKQQ